MSSNSTKKTQISYPVFTCIPIAPFFPEIIPLFEEVLVHHNFSTSLLSRLHITGLFIPDVFPNDENVIINCIDELFNKVHLPINSHLTFKSLKAFYKNDPIHSNVLYAQPIGPILQTFDQFNEFLYDKLRKKGFTKISNSKIRHLTITKSSNEGHLFDTRSALSETLSSPTINITEFQLVRDVVDESNGFYQLIKSIPLTSFNTEPNLMI